MVLSASDLFSVSIPDDLWHVQCRYIIYKKKLEDKIAIDSPKVLGGLKSEQYLALNPQGLMPLLVFPDGTSIPESEVNCLSWHMFHDGSSMKVPVMITVGIPALWYMYLDTFFAVAQVIAAYLADKYCEDGPSFQLSSPEQRANDLLARRIHDLYICSIQARHPYFSRIDQCQKHCLRHLLRNSADAHTEPALRECLGDTAYTLHCRI